jgi:hypothetical protein
MTIHKFFGEEVTRGEEIYIYLQINEFSYTLLLDFLL